MNGYVVIQGRDCGVSTPVYAAVVEVMHEGEQSTYKPAPENVGLALRSAGR